MKLSNIILLIMSLLMMAYQLTSSAGQTEEWCESKWVSDSGKLISNKTVNSNFDAMLAKWRSYEQICGKTVTYNTHLALIQMLQKDYDSAKATLEKVDNKGSYGYLVDSARMQLEIQERLFNNKTITKADFLRFENGYINILKKYPQWLNGYAFLGGVETELGKHQEAILNLEKAEKAQSYDLYYVYRNLTISHAALNQNQASLDAADKAYSLNSDIFSDPQFVIAYANVSTSEGYLADAQNALKVLLAKHPEFESNASFINAVDKFKQALERKSHK